MVDNIVDLSSRIKPKEEFVFACQECGNTKFWLDVQGTVSCIACKVTQIPPDEWIDNLNKEVEKWRGQED